MTNEEKILSICADVLNVDVSELSMDTACEDCDDLDSLAVVMIISEMESQFGKTIKNTERDAVKIEKISDFLKLVD